MNPTNTSNQQSLLDLLLQGGWAMIPLGLISLCLITLIFHCWQLTQAKRFDQFAENIADPSLSSDDREQKFEIFEGNIFRWIQYLNVLASISPMVGLLGTVSGMIGAFQTISAGGMGKPESLAGDIGEALITTATGLSIAIPAMVAYFYFRNRLEANLGNLTAP